MVSLARFVTSLSFVFFLSAIFNIRARYNATHIWASNDSRTQRNIQTKVQYLLGMGKKKLTIVKKNRRERKYKVKNMDLM